MLRIVKLRFHSNQLENFKSIFATHMPKLLRVAGCQSITLVQDQLDPNLAMTISEWESETHLNLYRHSQLFKATWRKVKPLFAQPAEVQNLDVLFSSTFSTHHQ